MNITDALRILGVTETTLTPDERRRLDDDGFLAFPDLISLEAVRNLNRRLAALVREEGDRAGMEVHQEAGAVRLSDLVNKDPMFDIVLTHPRVLAAVAHVLGGDLRFSSLNSRAALPGEGLQALHADWKGATAPGDYYVCNSLWMLDDFTEENGATRLVPGSHRWGLAPGDVLQDPKSANPDQVLATGRAGTVVVFNAHTWHGGTLNRSAAPRRAMHGYFGRRDVPQQTDQRKYVRPETLARLSQAARVVLDVD